MKFYRVYIELTNVCGLNCSFCPTKLKPNETMSLEFFENVIKEVKDYTNEIACHVMGDPMTLKNLGDYLDIIDKYNLKAILTTSGYYTKKQPYSVLFHRSIKQINFSLNAYNKNSSAISLSQYMEPILETCKQKQNIAKDIYINLRVWNLDEDLSEESFNKELFKILEDRFNIKLDIKLNSIKSKDSIRLDYKTLLHFDNYFEWPSLNNPIYGDGTCQGLNSHIAILANGVVVPCCLDGDGVINLGNIKKESLKQILQNKIAQDMINGFKVGKCSQELCLKCSYKDRFNN